MTDIISDNLSSIARVFSKTETGPGIAISRSLGDLMAHSLGVSSQPEVTLKIMDSEDKFVILASDGVWDVMNTPEVVGFVLNELNDLKEEKQIAEDLVNEARSRWDIMNIYKNKYYFEKTIKNKNVQNTEDRFNTVDDISVVVCFTNFPHKSREN